jgi:hypothetical protein
VPPQALFLLNSPFALDHARFAAERLLAEPHCDDASRIDRAFRLALGRPPSVAEIATARRFLADHERAAAPEPVQPVEPAKPLTRAQKKKAAAAARENAAIQAPLRLRAWSGLCQLLMASPEFRYIH